MIQATNDVEVSPSNEIEGKRKLAKQRVFAMTLIVFVVIAGGSFACVFFGVSEIVNRDRILMNKGLGEVMTVLGICFILPYVFCLIAFITITMGFPCCVSDITPRASRLVVIVFTIASVIGQQVIMDVYLVACLGPVAAVAVVLDVGMIGCYVYWRMNQFYVPTMCSVLLCLGKMAALWNFVSKEILHNPLGPNPARTFVFLTLPIVQLPLYITKSPSNSEEGYIDSCKGMASKDDTVVESFNSNFNLLLLHLLNSLDIISVYTSFLSKQPDIESPVAIPEPFRILIMMIIGLAFFCNNASVIHLFYRRSGVENAELIFLPKKLREATNQLSSSDAGGTHKRRIIQYMLLLLLVCDIPLLAVRVQLWVRGHHMLNVFVTKNIKSIVDALMIVMRADRTSGHSDRSWHLLS